MSAWTQSEVKLLEDGYIHGLSIKEIQEKLPNRSAEAYLMSCWKQRKS